MVLSKMMLFKSSTYVVMRLYKPAPTMYTYYNGHITSVRIYIQMCTYSVFTQLEYKIPDEEMKHKENNNGKRLTQVV